MRAASRGRRPKARSRPGKTRRFLAEKYGKNITDLQTEYFNLGVESKSAQKAFLRAQLWDPSRYVDRSALPSSGEIHRSCDPGFDADAYDEERAGRYARREGFY